MPEVVIIMGSKKDRPHGLKIRKVLSDFGIENTMRIASAHKTPRKLLDIIDEYSDENVIYITIAGRSNALSGMVDANTTQPVIASPPYSEKFAGADIFSSLRMPSGVGPLLVLGKEQAAVAAVKMISLSDESLKSKLIEYMDKYKNKVNMDDREVKSG